MKSGFKAYLHLFAKRFLIVIKMIQNITNGQNTLQNCTLFFIPPNISTTKHKNTHIIGVSPGILENSLCLSIFYVVLKLDKTFYNIPNISFKHPII